MNKTDLIASLSARLGDRKSATAALNAVLAEIQYAVTKGDKVSITGFGVFEKRIRAARTARNPRTGESVKVKKTSVPAFRPGATFKELVAAGKIPKAAKTIAPAKKTPATPVKTVAAPATRTAIATAKAPTQLPKPTKAVNTTAAQKPAAVSKKTTRTTAAGTTSRTATARNAAAKTRPHGPHRTHLAPPTRVRAKG